MMVLLQPILLVLCSAGYVLTVPGSVIQIFVQLVVAYPQKAWIYLFQVYLFALFFRLLLVPLQLQQDLPKRLPLSLPISNKNRSIQSILPRDCIILGLAVMEKLLLESHKFA